MLKKAGMVLFVVLVLLALMACGSDPYENSMYSEQPEIVTFQDYLAANSDLPAGGIDPILTQGSEKAIIETRGLMFKDSNGNGELDDYEDWRLPVRERAEALVAAMSAEEKIGLMSWTGSTGNDTMTSEDDTTLYGIGGLGADGSIEEDSFAERVVTNGIRYGNASINLDPMVEVTYNNMVQGLAERMSWGIPFIMSADPSHDGWNGNEAPVNGLSRWPYYMGLGALDDYAVTQEFAETVSAEFKMLGRRLILGPMAEIATEPRWARVQHAIHSDADTVGAHIEVLIRALQGGDELSTDGIAATIKHFPGSGSVEEGMDSHSFSGRYSIFTEESLEEHLKPFEAGFDANPAMVMSLYSIVEVDGYQDSDNGQPVAEGTAYNKSIMTDLLRGTYGFDGTTVTDWSVIGNSAWGHMDERDTPELAAQMVDAGIHHYGGDDITNLFTEAYAQGLITDEQIDFAVTRSLELQFKLGLFENPYTDLAEAESFWNPEGTAKQARLEAGEEAMSRAMVLAKVEPVGHAIDLVPINGVDEGYVGAADRNGNGMVDVYFDSVFPDADSGQPNTYAFSNDDQYLGVNFVDSYEEADIAIVRFFARGSTYFGTQGGTPLTFTDPVRVWDRDAQEYTDEEVYQFPQEGMPFAEFGRWTFSDWSFRTGDGIFNGYMTYLGGDDSAAVVERALAAKAANPGLKLIMGMTASRPGIVTDFIDEADAFFIDFAATDRAFLNTVFWQAGIEPEGRLPIEFPANMESVLAQRSDVAGDTVDPVFEVGHGISYVTAGGYGN